MGYSSEGKKWISTAYWSGWGYYRCYINVWVDSTTSTDSQAKIRGTVLCQLYNTDGWGGSRCTASGGKNYSYDTGTGGVQPNSYVAETWCNTNWCWSDFAVETVNKTQSSQTLSYECSFSYGYETAVKATASVTVPAKPSYTVSYNANGGSGAPSNQTKWYGENLTLSSTVPTKTGYAFLGWSTSSTATSATYSAGGTYSSNSAATLYAVWEAQAAPITSASNINLNENAVITWTPLLTPSQYKIKLETGSWSYTFNEDEYISASTTDPITWNTYTVPIEVANQITTASTGTMTATLYTYSGTSSANAVLLGSATRTFTVTVPSSNTSPSISITNITALDDSNNALYNVFGAGSSSSNTFFIKGMSTVRIVVSLTRGSDSSTNLKYNATLKEVKLEVGTGTTIGSNKLSTVTSLASSNTSATVISDVLNPTIASGTQNVRFWYRITVTDSRSYTATVSSKTYPDSSLAYIHNYWTPSGSVTYAIQEDHSIKTIVTWDAASLSNNNNLVLILTREKAGDVVAIVNKTLSTYSSSTTYKKGDLCQYRTSSSNPYYIYEYIYATPSSNKVPTNTTYWNVIGLVDSGDGGEITTGSYSGTYTWEQESIDDANMSTYSYTFTVKDPTNSNSYTASTGLVCISRHRGGRGVTFFADASDDEISEGGLWANSIKIDLTAAEYANLASLIADTYSSSTTYSLGDFCTYTVSGTVHTYEYIYNTSASNKVPTNTTYWVQLA